MTENAPSQSTSRMLFEKSSRPEFVFIASGAGMMMFSMVSGLQYLTTRLWQYGLTGITALVMSLICLSMLVIKIKSLSLRFYFAQLAITVLFFLQVILFSSIFLIASPSLFLYSFLLSTYLFDEKRNNAPINMGLGSAFLAGLMDVFSPFKQVESVWYFCACVVMFGFLCIWTINLNWQHKIFLNLKTKLVIAGITVTLIPSILIGFIQAQQLNQTVREQTQESLRFAATQTALKVDDYLQSNKDIISRDATLAVFSEFISTQPSERSGSSVETNLRQIVETLQKRPQAYLSSYGLLDLQGMNIYDTNPAEVGRFEASRSYFQAAVSSGLPFISNIEFSTFNGDPYIFFSSPIKSKGQKIIGVLRARYDASVFQKMAEDNMSLLGARSYPILVDENLTRVADTITPNALYKSLVPLSSETYSKLLDEKRLPDYPVGALATNFSDLAAAIKNGEGNPNINFRLFTGEEQVSLIQETGYVTKLTNKPWSLIYMQEQANLVILQTNQVKTTTLFSTLIAGVVSLMAILGASVLARPINLLTRTALRITDGDLNVRATVSGQDEVGTLGKAFNMMTERLRNLVEELEEKIQVRTKELENQNIVLLSRNHQIQTISEVAKGITSTQDLEQLLLKVSTVLSERFGFYHVGIFLLDKNREYAELRAANSDGGKRMLDRHHKLKVGQIGIVGYVTGSGKPRIALDVGEDTVHFKNPDLPLTRSEMALPLLYNAQVIGALDVQSEKMNAFTDQDIDMFSTLADQIAIAIQNSRLYQETNRALEESQILHRQYLRQEWIKFEEDQLHLGFIQGKSGLIPIRSENLQYIDSETELGNITIENREENGENYSILNVPVILRGETIAVIQLRDKGSSGIEWNEEDKVTARMISDQVSQALENARLFEQTVQRAERERRVMEITNKIRSTNQPETMMEIAREELQRALHASHVEVVFNDVMVQYPDHEPTGTNIPKNNGHKDH